MNAFTIFSIANTATLLAWVTMIVLYRRPLAVRIARAFILFLCVLYALVLAGHWGEGEGGFGTLQEVMKLFDNPWITLGGWVHYLAFDLFIGSWIVEQGRLRQLTWWRYLPALPLTFLFGPAGLGLYFFVNGRDSAHA